MFQFESHTFDLIYDMDGGDAARDGSAQSPGAGRTTDGALDAALRNVPLPQGMLTRFSLLAYTMPEDAADSVDWLGC
jgi:hypothetical protein